MEGQDLREAPVWDAMTGQCPHMDIDRETAPCDAYGGAHPYCWGCSALLEVCAETEKVNLAFDMAALVHEAGLSAEEIREALERAARVHAISEDAVKTVVVTP